MEAAELFKHLVQAGFLDAGNDRDPEGGSSGAGRSYGKSSGHSTNHGESYSGKGRRLLIPDEVMRLPLSKQLLFVKGSAPLVVDIASGPAPCALFRTRQPLPLDSRAAAPRSR